MSLHVGLWTWNWGLCWEDNGHYSAAWMGWVGEDIIIHSRGPLCSHSLILICNTLVGHSLMDVGRRSMTHDGRNTGGKMPKMR